MAIEAFVMAQRHHPMVYCLPDAPKIQVYSWWNADFAAFSCAREASMVRRAVPQCRMLAWRQYLNRIIKWLGLITKPSTLDWWYFRASWRQLAGKLVCNLHIKPNWWIRDWNLWKRQSSPEWINISRTAQPLSERCWNLWKNWFRVIARLSLGQLAINPARIYNPESLIAVNWLRSETSVTANRAEISRSCKCGQPRFWVYKPHRTTFALL